MATPIRGQCLCGAVRYRVVGRIDHSIVCFCSHCRQAQGGLGAWNSPLDAALFQLDDGADALAEYRHTAGKARVFCRHCGTPLYSYRDDLPGVLRLRLGSVTDGPLPAPQEYFYSAQKPPFLTHEN